MLVPAGYVTTVYDPVFKLSDDGMRYVSAPAEGPTTIPAPGLPFSLVFRAEPGREDVVLKIASAYEAALLAGASPRRISAHFRRCLNGSLHSSSPRKRGPRIVGRMPREISPCVYILASRRNGTLYVGVTGHLARRVWEHRSGAVPKFQFRQYAVHRLVFAEFHDTMESAILREKRIKKWRRLWKLELIERENPEWRDLYDELAV